MLKNGVLFCWIILVVLLVANNFVPEERQLAEEERKEHGLQAIFCFSLYSILYYLEKISKRLDKDADLRAEGRYREELEASDGEK